MAIPKGLNIGRLKESVKGGVKAAQEGLSKVDASRAAQDAKDLAKRGVSNVSEAVKGVAKRSAEVESEKASPVKSFIALLWLLAYIDGDASEGERARISELAKLMDEGYDAYAEGLEAECAAKMERDAREFGRVAAAKMTARSFVAALDVSRQEAKLVCWNLLAVASSDGISDDELGFTRFVSEELGVSPAVFEELENYSAAVVEIASSRERLRESQRSYAEIEPLVKELENRERTIIEAAQALVTDR